MKSFKFFLLNEGSAYLGHRVGDVLTSAHDLQDDIDNLGARQVARMADLIVNQIRKILHSQWQSNQREYLKDLQAVAVLIKKAIDDKNRQGSTYDLKETIKIAIQKLEDISGKLGGTVNKLQAPPANAGEEISQQDFELTGNGPTPPQTQQQPQQPPPQAQPQI